MTNIAASADHLLTTRMEQLAEMDAAPLNGDLCYFFGAREGVVKIGHSTSVVRRFKQVKGSSLYKLAVLAIAPGGRTREGHYHRRFEAHAIGGEWFQRCPEIEAEITSLAARFSVHEVLPTLRI